MKSCLEFVTALLCALFPALFLAQAQQTFNIEDNRHTSSFQVNPARAQQRRADTGVSGYVYGFLSHPRRPVRDVTKSMMIAPPEPWEFTKQDSCLDFLQKIGRAVGEAGWCPGVTDEVLCWPAAAPGSQIRHRCPHFQGVDPSKFALKTCNDDGTWWKKSTGDASQEIAGYTDYDPCFTEETQLLLNTFVGSGGGNDSFDQTKFAVVIQSRNLELAGYSLSFTCVLISLFIFRYFRSLRCARTTIHVNLFTAIALMTLCKTIEVADQHISGYVHKAQVAGEVERSIRTTRPLCEILVVLLEYSRTAMFMWMFLEGLYMHNVVAWKVFQASKPNYWLYGATGWGFPALVVAAWAPVIEFVWFQQNLIQKNSTNPDHCWYQHANSPYYYIVDVPRTCFIAINLLFLINIIRVLLTKLRDSHQSDTVQIRKAVKATIVLAPLLGITNLLWGAIPPNFSTWPFAWIAIWLYLGSFLRSFEGIFVCMIYCFLNGEVQAAIKSACERRAVQRETNRSAHARRVSSLSSSHLTRYMQVNRESVQSSAGEPANRRDATNRILKLLNCWPTNRANNNGMVRTYRNHSSIPPENTTIQLHINGTITEEKEENIEM